jgi:hypothetical protein
MVGMRTYMKIVLDVLYGLLTGKTLIDDDHAHPAMLIS